MKIPFTELSKMEENCLKKLHLSSNHGTSALLSSSFFVVVVFTLTLQSLFNQKTRGTSPKSITIVSSLHLKKSFREINKILSMVIQRPTHYCNLLWYKTISKTPSLHYHTGGLSLCKAHFSSDLFSVCVLRRIGVIVLKKSFFNTFFFWHFSSTIVKKSLPFILYVYIVTFCISNMNPICQLAL